MLPFSEMEPLAPEPDSRIEEAREWYAWRASCHTSVASSAYRSHHVRL